MGRFCTNCGKPLKEGAKFCGNCGEAVEEKDAVRPKVMVNRPYRPAESQRLPGEANRHEPVQQRQSSGGGFWHFLAGTAVGGFLWNLFGGSSHQETVINHNETIINEYDDDEGLMEERLGDGLWYDEDDSYGTGYDDQDDYGDDSEDSYDDDGYDDDDDYDSYDGDEDGGFFDDFDGGDDFGDDDFF